MGFLRLILALIVVIAHGLTDFLGFPLFNAVGAVWTFFAISGFLITIALAGEYHSAERGLASFYWNRAIRLYPSYWVWLLITILVYFFVPREYVVRGFEEDGSYQSSGFWRDHAGMASAGTLVTAVIANVTGLFSDALLDLGFDKGVGVLKPAKDAAVWAMPFVFIGQFWTIGVEICFYLLAPFLSQRLPSVLVVFFLSASGYLEKAWQWLGHALYFPEPLTYIRAPKHLWMFMVGVLLGRLYLELRKKEDASFRAVVACLVLAYGFMFYRRAELFFLPPFPWWLFFILTALIPLLFSRTKDNKLDRFVGDLSYPVYVNHFLVIQVASAFFAPNGLLFSAISIGLAIAMVLFVERPRRRLRR